MPSRFDTSTQIGAVANELWKLMRKKQGQVDAISFPAVTQASRVQQEANRLGHSLSNGEELRTVLRTILRALAQQELKAEKAVKDAEDDEEQEEEDTEAKRDYRLAKPFMELLGLTASTAYMRIGKREEAARKSRRVALSTLRNDHHAKQMALEVAAYLLDESPSEDASNSVSTGSSKLGEVRQHDTPETFSALTKPEIRQFAVQLVVRNREFYKALADLHGTLDFPGRDYPVDDYELYASLYVFAGEGDTGLEWFWDLPDVMEEREAPASRNRFCWFARVLRALKFLPAFGGREKDLLSHAYTQANGSLHVFLEVIERTQTGKELLEMWAETLRPRIGEQPPVSKWHFMWTAGLASAELLVHPGELDQLAQTDIAQYVLDNGAEKDRNWIAAAIKHSGEESSWWRIDDSPEDREFLKGLNAASTVDTGDISLTLRRLLYK